MKITTMVRVRRQANSYIITIPKGFVREGKLNAGKMYLVNLDFEEVLV